MEFLLYCHMTFGVRHNTDLQTPLQLRTTLSPMAALRPPIVATSAVGAYLGCSTIMMFSFSNLMSTSCSSDCGTTTVRFAARVDIDLRQAKTLLTY